MFPFLNVTAVSISMHPAVCISDHIRGHKCCSILMAFVPALVRRHEIQTTWNSWRPISLAIPHNPQGQACTLKGYSFRKLLPGALHRSRSTVASTGQSSQCHKCLVTCYIPTRPWDPTGQGLDIFIPRALGLQQTLNKCFWNEWFRQNKELMTPGQIRNLQSEDCVD